MSYLALLFCQDEKTARTVTQVLSELEFEVDTCGETFGAVKKLTSQPFEAVVVDCQDEESASLLLKAARNSTFNQQSLMVALVEGQAGVAAAFRIGANLVLTKPIAVEQARGTLRVARGLLRKNSGAGAPPSTAAAASPAAPASFVKTPILTAATGTMTSAATAATPQISAQAVAAPKAPAPNPEPNWPLATPEPTPAPTPAAAVPVAPRMTPSAPVQPSAFRAVASASASLEQQSEPQPSPDAASAGLLESLASSSHPAAPQSSFAPSTGEYVSANEVDTGAHQAVRAALAPKVPVSPEAFAARSEAKFDLGGGTYGAGAGAAAAPAREQLTATFSSAPVSSTEASSIATASTPAAVSDLFEAPVFGQPSAAVAAEHASTYEPEVDFTGSPAASRSTMPFVAVAAVFVLAAALYFGWSQLHKPTPATTPTAGPLQPPPPDFGAADAPPTPAAAASSHAKAPVTDDAAPVESVNRFAHSDPKMPDTKVAEDRVTAPNAALTPRSLKTPMEVKTQLQPAAKPASAGQEAPETAPTINLGTSAKPDALSAIGPSSTSSPALPQLQRVSQGVSEAKLVKSIQPIYPPQALQMHAQGIVALTAWVAKDGSVRDVKVVSGPAVLTRSAIDAVRQWKYKPFTLNGEPVENQVDVKINFVPPR